MNEYEWVQKVWRCTSLINMYKVIEHIEVDLQQMYMFMFIFVSMFMFMFIFMLKIIFISC
jgi:hypothetical protein